MEERGATDLWSKIFGQEIDDALFVTARDANFIDVSGTAVIYLRELQLRIAIDKFNPRGKAAACLHFKWTQITKQPAGQSV